MTERSHGLEDDTQRLPSAEVICDDDRGRHAERFTRLDPATRNWYHVEAPKSTTTWWILYGLATTCSNLAIQVLEVVEAEKGIPISSRSE